MNPLVFGSFAARLASVWVRESTLARHPLALGFTWPDIDPKTLIALIVAGVVAVVLVVLVAVQLARWVVSRKRKPTGIPLPIEEPELYDLRMGEVHDDVHFWLEVAKETGGPVLELGAKTGRVTLPLARTGLLVTALEPTRLMSQRAQTKAEQLAPKVKIEWLESDLSNFSLPGRAFRLIIAPNAALQTLPGLMEMEQCLRCVAEHLEPDGKFVVAVQAARWEKLKLEHHLMQAVYNPRTSELVNCYHTLEVDPVWHKLRGAYDYDIWNHAGKVRKVHAPYTGSYLTCPEMALLLRSAGMELVSVYGSYARDPLTVKSQQMIFLARRLKVAAPTPGQVALPPARQAAPVPAALAAPAKDAVTPASVAALPAPQPALASVGSSAAGSQPAPDATLLNLPALPSPDASSAESLNMPGDASAQGMQPPTDQPPGGRSTDQRRKAKPIK